MTVMQPDEALPDVLQVLRRSRVDTNKGDEVFRFGFNAGIDAAISIVADHAARGVPSNADSSEMREAFERWANLERPSIWKHTTTYVGSGQVEIHAQAIAWDAWQAACAATPPPPASQQAERHEVPALPEPMYRAFGEGRSTPYEDTFSASQMRAYGRKASIALADAVGRVALRLAQDAAYRYRAAEDLLRLIAGYTDHQPLPPALSSEQNGKDGNR